MYQRTQMTGIINCSHYYTLIGTYPKEVPGLSPFELLFGHKVRGSLDLLHQNWEDYKESDPESIIEYMDNLMKTLQKSLEIAEQNLKAAQEKQINWYDKKAQGRTFCPEDKVLMMGPIKGNKL